MERLQALTERMIEFDAGSPGRIQHFLKVHAFAKMIGEKEGLKGEALETLEAAALVHDIGIGPALEKYGSSNGPLQEKEGAPLAGKMLKETGFTEAQAERVRYLTGHHHTYSDIDGIDYQILVEADFLVNIYESQYSDEKRRNVFEHIFRTEYGKWLFTRQFGIDK